MKYLVMHHGYKPKYYDLCGEKKGNICTEVQAHHIACFYGIMMAIIFSSNTSIDNMFSVCKNLDSILCVNETITKDAYKDLYCCMHFVDDWEEDSDEEWQEFFHDTKVVVNDTTAAH